MFEYSKPEAPAMSETQKQMVAQIIGIMAQDKITYDEANKVLSLTAQQLYYQSRFLHL